MDDISQQIEQARTLINSKIINGFDGCLRGSVDEYMIGFGNAIESFKNRIAEDKAYWAKKATESERLLKRKQETLERIQAQFSDQLMKVFNAEVI